MNLPRDILTDPDDYILDLSSKGEPADGAGGRQAAVEGSAASGARRPFLSIHFKCCGVYNRIYRNPAGDAYAGHCPRCAKPVRVGIGAGGSPGRSFEVE